MPYKISIILADFPAIDPNITYKYSELKTMGFDIVKVGKLHYNDEHFIRYGTTVEVLMRVFDRVKIQKDYSLDSLPSYVSNDKESCIFSTGDTVIEIDTQTVKDEYMVMQKTDFVVVSKKELGFIYDDDEIVNDVIRTLQKETTHYPAYNTCYSLSISLASKIHKYFKIPYLFGYYEEGISPLFIKIEPM